MVLLLVRTRFPVVESSAAQNLSLAKVINGLEEKHTEYERARGKRRCQSLDILAVERFRGKGIEIDTFKGTDIDPHFGEGDSFGEGLNTADLAKTVAEDFLIEVIVSKRIIALLKHELVLVHEGENKTFDVAVRTVTDERLFKIRFDRKRDCAAVAASFICFHRCILPEKANSKQGRIEWRNRKDLHFSLNMLL